jgi:hypothetical protein
MYETSEPSIQASLLGVCLARAVILMCGEISQREYAGQLTGSKLDRVSRAFRTRRPHSPAQSEGMSKRLAIAAPFLDAAAVLATC